MVTTNKAIEAIEAVGAKNLDGASLTIGVSSREEFPFCGKLEMPLAAVFEKRDGPFELVLEVDPHVVRTPIATRKGVLRSCITGDPIPHFFITVAGKMVRTDEAGGFEIPVFRDASDILITNRPCPSFYEMVSQTVPADQIQAQAADAGGEIVVMSREPQLFLYLCETDVENATVADRARMLRGVVEIDRPEAKGKQAPWRPGVTSGYCAVYDDKTLAGAPLQDGERLNWVLSSQGKALAHGEIVYKKGRKAYPIDITDFDVPRRIVLRDVVSREPLGEVEAHLSCMGQRVRARTDQNGQVEVPKDFDVYASTGRELGIAVEGYAPHIATGINGGLAAEIFMIPKAEIEVTLDDALLAHASAVMVIRPGGGEPSEVAVALVDRQKPRVVLSGVPRTKLVIAAVSASREMYHISTVDFQATTSVTLRADSVVRLGVQMPVHEITSHSIRGIQVIDSKTRIPLFGASKHGVFADGRTMVQVPARKVEVYADAGKQWCLLGDLDLSIHDGKSPKLVSYQLGQNPKWVARTDAMAGPEQK
jgi:hypothetical protein